MDCNVLISTQHLSTTTNQSSIDIIFGPMFSGKTTELMRRLTICAEAQFNVLYINSALDKREDRGFSTHNDSLKESMKISFIKTDKLMDTLEKAKQHDIIGIDEAQFYPDLKEFCLHMAEVHDKKVIVAGLSGDFTRKSFGQIIDLIPLCDNITKLFPFCHICRFEKHVVTAALFSKRICADNTTTVVIGKSESYIPVCRRCYNI